MIWMVIYCIISFFVFTVCMYIIVNSKDPAIVKFSSVAQFFIATFVALLWPLMVLIGIIEKMKVKNE